MVYWFLSHHPFEVVAMEVIKRNYLRRDIHLQFGGKIHRKCLHVYIVYWKYLTVGQYSCFTYTIFFFRTDFPIWVFFLYFRSFSFYHLLFEVDIFDMIPRPSNATLKHIPLNIQPALAIIPSPNRGIYASELVHPMVLTHGLRSTSISFFGQIYYAAVVL